MIVMSFLAKMSIHERFGPPVSVRTPSALTSPLCVPVLSIVTLLPQISTQAVYAGIAGGRRAEGRMRRGVQIAMVRRVDRQRVAAGQHHDRLHDAVDEDVAALEMDEVGPRVLAFAADLARVADGELARGDQRDRTAARRLVAGAVALNRLLDSTRPLMSICSPARITIGPAEAAGLLARTCEVASIVKTPTPGELG